MSFRLKLSVIVIAGVLLSSSSLLPALAQAAGPVVNIVKPVLIRAGFPEEKPYLVDDHSALLETSSDPACPYIRIGDMQTMYYVYEFTPGRGSMAYLLLTITSQFLTSVSSDGGKTYVPVSEMKKCELVGTRVLIDLTPFLNATDSVLVRFEDRYKEDGWGSLLTEIRYYKAGSAPESRIVLGDGWRVGSTPYVSGHSVASKSAVRFSTEFAAPAGWKGQDLAVYFPSFSGTPTAVRVNGSPLLIKRTWDQGYWAGISALLKPGASNRVEVDVKPQNGKAGMWAPVRVGLRQTTCAVPMEKSLDSMALKPNHEYEPYTPEKMNYLAGNFMQCLYDKRYDLLAFAPSESMTVHYVHDTMRSLVALAEEERYAPVVRIELARKLYKGCRGAMLPGGEYLFAFKHDERPIDIRPMPKSSDLTVVQKMDNWSYVCSVGLATSDGQNGWIPADKHSDTPAKRSGMTYSFTRDWTAGTRDLPVKAMYGHGGSGIAPSFEVSLDGKGPVRINLGKLTENGMWFTPGSWGPESAVLPDGKEIWAYKQDLSFANPSFRYLFIRGGNGLDDTKLPDYSYCKALMVMWDHSPSRITANKTTGAGRRSALWTDLVLEYENRTPGKVRLTLMPFAGYPDSLKAPRAIAENLLKTGRFGTGWYDPVYTTNCNAIGPDGMAAAAYLFKKYGTPEAKEAERFAVKCMQATVDMDRAGTRTNELYYLLRGCTYMHLMGHKEFDPWMRTWADRLLAAQKPDGSWEWLNYQLRCMEGLLHAYETLGDVKYLDAVKKGLTTMSYKDGNLYWQNQVQYYDDFGGALTTALYGYLGMPDMVQKALGARKNYVSDGGYVACSDLNPYMLGLAAHGLGLKSGKKLILGLTDWAIYDDKQIRRVDFPTAYVVNPNHPLAGKVDFELAR